MTRPAPSVALDALRATAALLVLLSHARDMLVADAETLRAPGLAARAFMAVSGLGHQAVIVFFVLSGYLVTNGMRRSAAAGDWSLPSFAVARLTRLWVVLVPCLVLGGCLDALGLVLRGPGAAAVAYGVPPVNGPVIPPALGPGVALGNLAFLQTVAVPVFGSNGALWSLSNEAWYYTLAGLAFAAWRRRKAPLGAAPFLLAAAVIALALPVSMMGLAPVWAFGAAVAAWPAPTHGRLRRVVPAGLACAALLVVSRLRLGPSLGLDILLGASVTLLIRRLAVVPNPSASRITAVVASLSRLSYSLYLSHTPVLALFATLAVGSVRQPLGAAGVGLVMTGMALALLVAALMWWGFERHTERCRRIVWGWWVGRRMSSPLAIAGPGGLR